MNLEELIKELKDLSINPKTNIPIELVIQLDRLRKEINRIERPLFINEEGNVVNQYWEDFQMTGLNNIDYITSEFYEEGFTNDDY